jgi:tetratricopeptide (TPR) repeat protein
MFTKTIGGKTLVGNNEDWKDTEPVVWFQPGEDGRYDCMYVGFGDLFPQGGMNEAGLCFDGFATAPNPIKKSLKKPVYEGWLNTLVMKTCSRIDELIAVFDKYNLQSFEMAMLMFVDSTGDAVIIEGDEYIRKQGDFQIVTNFYQSLVKDGEDTGCVRYNNLLAQLPEMEVTVDNFALALASVHSEGKYPTQYSNIFDPNKLEMYLYHFHDYTNFVTFDLRSEMEKGFHVIEMSEIFPELYAYEAFKKSQSGTMAKELERIINSEGLKAALEKYSELKENKKTEYKYPIDEFDMNDLGYMYLSEGKIDEAIAIFKLNVQNFPENWNCYDSLGEAYMNAGKDELAIKNYERSIELNPQNEAGTEMLKKIKNK